jgi:hypothetical protein
MPDAYPDLVPAIVAAFNAHANLPSAFPGGLVDAMAAPEEAYPYARFTLSEPQPGESAEDQRFTIAFAVYATPDDDAARAAGKLLFGWIDPNPGRSRFSAGGWTETTNRRMNPAGELIPIRQTPDGTQVWRQTVTYEFWAAPDGTT